MKDEQQKTEAAKNDDEPRPLKLKDEFRKLKVRAGTGAAEERSYKSGNFFFELGTVKTGFVAS